MTRKYQNISIDDLEPPEKMIRTQVELAELEELRESIKKQGIIEPLVVRKKGDKYEIIAGFRRWCALKSLNKKTAPCIVVEADDVKADLMRLHENFYREDMNPVDVARWFQYLQSQYSMSIRRIAELTGMSVAYVDYKLQLLRYPKELIEALEKEQISEIVAKELSKVQDDNVRKSFLKLAIDRGANSVTVRTWIQNYEKDERLRQEYKKAAAENKPLPPPPPYKEECWNCHTKWEYRLLTHIMLCPNCYQALMEATRKMESTSES